MRVAWRDPAGPAIKMDRVGADRHGILFSPWGEGGPKRRMRGILQWNQEPPFYLTLSLSKGEVEGR